MYKLAGSHIKPGAKSQTAGCNISRKDTQISVFKIPKAKSGMPEHKNRKKTYKYPYFFLSRDYVLNHRYEIGYHSCLYSCCLFQKCSHYNSSAW